MPSTCLINFLTKRQVIFKIIKITTTSSNEPRRAPKALFSGASDWLSALDKLKGSPGHIFTPQWWQMGLPAQMTTLLQLSDPHSLTLALPHPTGTAWREEMHRVTEGRRCMEHSQAFTDRLGISLRKDRWEAAGESGVQKGPMNSLIMS